MEKEYDTRRRRSLVKRVTAMQRIVRELPGTGQALFDSTESAALATALYGEPIGKGLRSAQLVRGEAMVADGASVYLLDDEFIMLLSPAAFPHAMMEQAAAMRAMSERLEQPAARPILKLRAEGRLRGLSYLAVPRCNPLSTRKIIARIDRWRVRSDVLGWLREVAASADPPNRAATEEFARSLGALSATAGIAGTIAAAADRYRRKLMEGELMVGHVPMHGDLWQGNLMRQRDGSLAIIDWGGSAPNGYGLYDLIRLGSSLGIPSARMKQEIAWHSDTLGGDSEIAPLHLLAGLGHYAARLGEFPRERFVKLATHCFDMFERLR